MSGAPRGGTMLRGNDFRPPSIAFNGRLWPSEELAATAAGWLDRVQSLIPRTAKLTALRLPNRPDAIALFFALSSLPLPVVVLPPDPRAWHTSREASSCRQRPSSRPVP